MRIILKGFTALGMIASMAVITVPVRAADPVPVETRVDRLEKEMRAVQRKVFPGGAPVQPDITAAPAAPPPAPEETPVTDLIARVTALEGQIATLTGQTEQNSYKMRQLEDRLSKLEAAQAAPPAVAAVNPAAAATPAKAVSPTKAVPTGASEARKAAIAAIAKPDTGDAANDAFAYGFRLWDAKFYPEAQTQLQATLDKYGNTSVGSRAANLLGRAYLDDGKPALAAKALYDNYQTRPNGDRAAQSLAYLAEALIQLKKPSDACRVYKQLESDYSASLTSDIKGMMEKGRTRAKCGT